MAAAGWQDEILDRLAARDVAEGLHRDFILQQKRLVQHTIMLKERNKALLRAASSTHGGSSNAANPVQQAYITSLEAQISSMREEVSTSYRTQSQNVSRLLSLTDQLREQEDLARTATDTSKSLKADITTTQQKLQDAKDSIKEKERVLLNLNDELATLTLEFTQLEKKNEALRIDNRNLLQRWLDRVNSEVSQVNEANAFIESTARMKPKAGEEADVVTKEKQ